MKKILVTGSAGFMGSHLYDRLFGLGHQVYGVDDLSGGFMRNVSQKKFFTQLDLRDREKTKKYIHKLGPEIIFHLAADATEGRSQFTPFSAIDRNLVAYINLLIPAIKNGMKKMLLVSSMSVYGAQQVPFKEAMSPRPEDIYGMSKAFMEKMTEILADIYGFSYTIVRPHNVYGPRQNLSDPYRNVLGIFINCLLHNKPFYIYGDGEQKRAFSYIDEVTDLVVKAGLNKNTHSKIINVGSDKPYTVNQLVKIITESFFGINKIPRKIKPIYLPDRPREVRYAYSNHSISKKLLGFKEQTGLREGVKKMLSWARELGPQEFKYLNELELMHEKVPKTWKSRLL